MVLWFEQFGDLFSGLLVIGLVKSDSGLCCIGRLDDGTATCNALSFQFRFDSRKEGGHIRWVHVSSLRSRGVNERVRW